MISRLVRGSLLLTITLALSAPLAVRAADDDSLYARSSATPPGWSEGKKEGWTGDRPPGLERCRDRDDDDKKDRADVRQDRRDLAKDRADVRQDRRDVKKDRADLRADRKQLKDDKADDDMAAVAKDRADLRSDRADLKKDRRDLHADRHDVGADARDLHADRHDVREDRRDPGVVDDGCSDCNGKKEHCDACKAKFAKEHPELAAKRTDLDKDRQDLFARSTQRPPGWDEGKKEGWRDGPRPPGLAAVHAHPRPPRPPLHHPTPKPPHHR
jgi:hypothetical protein